MTEQPPIKISDVEVVRVDGRDCLRANIDGRPISFGFDPALRVETRIEPFLPIALLIGMATGRAIEADRSAPVSPQLLGNMGTYQRIIRQWNPEAATVKIDAETAPPRERNDMVVSTYSGGVDSGCTLVRRIGEITHLLYLSDFDRRSKDEWPTVEAEWRSRIRRLGKEPITVETNALRFAEEFGVSAHYSHGSILGGLLAYLAPRKAFIPGSHTYRDLKPWGSHPLLDILWSTETTHIEHDSLDLTRSEKTRVIAGHTEALAQLQVCWYARTDNCGRCSKCIRTMLALKIFGLGPGPFPDVDVLSMVKKLKPGNFSAASFCWDLMHQARRYGYPDVAAQLDQMLRRYKFDRDIRRLFKSMIGKSVATR